MLAHMQRVICRRPEVAYAVRCLSLLDQLELTLELLNECREPEPELPSNMIRFRPRRCPAYPVPRAISAR
jgi:hypothetical protein